jgi:hypothetical protein
MFVLSSFMSLPPGPLRPRGAVRSLYQDASPAPGLSHLSVRLLPRERSKTLTALVGAEPLVQAQAAEVQRLQFFCPRPPGMRRSMPGAWRCCSPSRPRLHRSTVC